MAEAACVSLLSNQDQQFTAIRAARIPEPREEVLEAGGIARPRVHQPALGQDIQRYPLGNGAPAQSGFIDNPAQVQTSLMQRLDPPELLQAYVASANSNHLTMLLQSRAFVFSRGTFVVRGLRRAVVVTQLLFDRQAQILDQVETVSDLPRRRRALPGGPSVEAAPVTTDNLDRRMSCEPGSHGVR